MTKHKNVALDELRILAALMVLGVHTGQKVGLGDAAAVGAQGVQLFFVLSGYLAAASLSRHPEPLPYYQRRIRRILPLYWLVLVLRWLFDAVRYLAAGTSAAQLFGPGGPCGPGYLRYFVFLQMWLPSDNWMLWNNRNVLWTMSAFAFFYLLAPWLYRLCKRFWGALALLVVCLAVKGRIGGLIESSLAAFPAEANISEFSAKTPVMTLYCFIFGMAAFAAVRENKQFLYGTFCILLAVLTNFQRAGFECVFTVLVLLAVQNPQGVGLAENQKFAQAVASGMNQSDAYREAYRVRNGTKLSSVNVNASKLMNDAKVAQRVAELRAPIVKNVQVTLENHLRDLMALRNLATKEKQMSAAINAEIARGKACGLYVEKLQHSNPDGTLRPQVIKIIAA